MRACLWRTAWGKEVTRVSVPVAKASSRPPQVQREGPSVQCDGYDGPWKPRPTPGTSAPSTDDPQGGTPCGSDGSPCGNDAPQCGPHSDETKIQRADKALVALTQMWTKAAENCPADAMNEKGAPALAIEFRRALYACPEIIGMGLSSGWVRAHYPLLCRSFGIRWPPPYKDFA
jgi:hypothetical protein